MLVSLYVISLFHTSLLEVDTTGADPGLCNGGGGGGFGNEGSMLNHLWRAVGPLHSQNILNFGVSWDGRGA